MTILPFESFEDLQKILDAQLLVAKASTTPEQWAVSYGDHYLSFIEDIKVIPVFGYICTREEIIELERVAGADKAEIYRVLDLTHARSLDGFRFNQAFSIITPNGEYGETHASLMVPISALSFETARRLHWSHPHLMTQAWYEHAVTRRKR